MLQFDGYKLMFCWFACLAVVQSPGVALLSFLCSLTHVLSVESFTACAVDPLDPIFSILSQDKRNARPNSAHENSCCVFIQEHAWAAVSRRPAIIFYNNAVFIVYIEQNGCAFNLVHVVQSWLTFILSLISVTGSCTTPGTSLLQTLISQSRSDLTANTHSAGRGKRQHDIMFRYVEQRICHYLLG